MRYSCLSDNIFVGQFFRWTTFSSDNIFGGQIFRRTIFSSDNIFEGAFTLDNSIPTLFISNLILKTFSSWIRFICFAFAQYLNLDTLVIIVICIILLVLYNNFSHFLHYSTISTLSLMSGSISSLLY